MKWSLDKNRPICPQICEILCVMIASKEVGPNEKLMSVREVALAAGVNPNTVQKSFEQLESEGLVYSARGLGWFVTENTEIATAAVDRLAKEKTEQYITEMARIGIPTEELMNYIKGEKKHE